MAFTLITQGSFTSDGTGQKVKIPTDADYFKVTNLTQLATTQSTGRGVIFEWYGNDLVPDGYAIETKKQNSSNALDLVMATSGGFTYVNSSPFIEAAVTGTAISKASSAVVSMTNTYSDGDVVILYGTTGMAQIAGMSFTISSVSGSQFTLSGLDSSGFATTASAVTARRISKAQAVEPSYLYITKVSKAASAVVTVSQLHSYVVGQKIRFNIPSDFGMVELNQLTYPAVITAVTDYTMTINVDSTAFTTFAFPASTSSPTAQLFATLTPAGQSTQQNYVTGTYTGYDFNYPVFKTGQFTPYMYLAAGAQSPAGSNGDQIVWTAYKMESTFYS